MSRGLTAEFVTAAEAASGEAYLLAEFEFPSGTIRYWTGYGDLVWNSNTYSGVGHLGGVSPFMETQTLQAEGIVFNLSGIPSSLISVATTEKYQDRVCRLYLALVSGGESLTDESGNPITDESGNPILISVGGSVIADPMRVFTGYMDVMEAQDDGGTSTLKLSAESVLTRLKRNKERRYTNEDQKSRYPDDDGLDQMNALQDQKIVWGRKSPA